MATQFNHWAQWTAGEILQSTDLRERTEILSTWIKVARVRTALSRAIILLTCSLQLCYKMGNFNTPFAILSGLSFASISRLSATWRSVPGKRLRRFHELEQLYTSQNAYRNLRFAMQNTPPPGVPYIGLYEILLLLLI